MATNIPSTIHDQQFLKGKPPIEGDSQELVGVLQKIVQNAGALLEANSCSVALLDTKGTTLITLAALHRYGRKIRHTRFRLNEGIAGWVATHREPLVSNDTRLDTRFKRLGRTPVGSMVCVPLIDDGNFIGTLTVSSQDINAFSENKVRILTVFADQAVLAITNARHAELAERQANQLEMLLDLSRGITTRLDIDSLYRTILTDVHRLVPYDHAILYQFNENTQDLSPIAESGTDLSRPQADLSRPQSNDPSHTENTITIKIGNIQREKIRLQGSPSVTAWAATHRHPMLRPPMKQVEKAEGDAGTAEGSAILAAPLYSKNVLYGVLELQRADAFSSEELRLVRNLSNMAAAALENVELFHLVRTDGEQLRAILASSTDGIAIVGLNGYFIEANPAFGHIFGIEPEQIVGMECLELFQCESKEEGAHQECHNLCMIQRALQSQEALSYKEVDLQIQGVSRSVGLSITPVSTMNKPLCMVMARDVTAIRDATRMKANFLSMITHELRSPLNAMHGYLDLALTGVGGELNEQHREFIQRARASSEHLYALVEDLLLVSRADSGQVRLNRELNNLAEIIRDAIDELELLALDSRITIDVQIASDFPQIYADAVRMQQVLRNLISNALRFTPSGGKVTISAGVLVQPADQQTDPDDEIQKLLVLKVSDTGIGIPLDQQERIFERFYQVPQTSRRSTGQGLGLAIVKMIVELHGGHITVESTPGQGSTFTCTIPCLLS